MAEVVGTAIGVVGLLGQLFDGCVKAYAYFTTAAQLDSDSARLLTKVQIEETRLLVWGREWGVAEGKLEAHLAAATHVQGSDVLSKMAAGILSQLHRTISDFKVLREKYGIKEEVGAGGASEGKSDGGRVLGKGKKGKKGGFGGASPNTSVDKLERGWKELTLRTRWAIGDKEKFITLLQDLKDFNDGLYDLFPPSRLPSLHRQWTHELLHTADRSLSELSLLEHASNGVYPQLYASANLKRLRINLDAKPQNAFKPTYAFRVKRDALMISMKEAGAKRIQAFYPPSGNVIIEWVDYANHEKMLHMRRLDDLARMMHQAVDCHPDLHTIDCVGYTDDVDMNRFGLVYRAPDPSFSTLQALIMSKDLKTPELQDRIRLAQTLSVALWSLHSLDWLHKSLCSNNILFFPSAFAASATQATEMAALIPDISSPYLVGFDASRPYLDTEVSVASRNPSIHDLHRHPELLGGAARGPYLKIYDIYSLGLVLLEIGMWKALQPYHKPNYPAEKWRKVVRSALVPSLGSKAGRIYREVVERCLSDNNSLSNVEADQLMESVVRDLESIRV